MSGGGLVGGVIGAVIGWASGGLISPATGWLVGSVFGNLLAPQNAGPDLTDLKPQSSEYGRPIPIVYSVMALGGNVIWASDLVQTGSAGGKGTPDASSSQATYAANFAILICEGPGKTLGRIWAGPDKRLVYDPATGKLESGSIRFYDGSEDQMPDPLMESYLGAGNVPAYRGYCYVVIEGFNVTNHDGNRIPFLTIEVGAQGTPSPNTGPENLGIVAFNNVWASSAGGGSYVLNYSAGSTEQGFIQVRQSDMTTMHNWLGEVGLVCRFWDDARNTAVSMLLGVGGATSKIYFTVNMTTGAVTDYAPWSIAGGDVTEGSGFGAGSYIFAVKRNSVHGSGILLEFVDPASNVHTKTLTVDAGDTDQIAQGGFICADPTSNVAWIVKASGTVSVVDLSATGSVSSTVVGALPTTVVGSINISSNEYRIQYDSISGLLWCARLTGTTVYYASFSSTGQVSGNSTTSSFSWLTLTAWAFIPPNGVWLCGSLNTHDHFMRFDPSSGAPEPVAYDDILSVEAAGSYESANGLDAVVYDPANDNLVGIRSNAVWAKTPTSDLFPAHLPTSSGVIGGSSTGGGGALAYNYQTLAQVVTDLSIRAGLTADDIDVTQLTDQVDGYTIANQVDVKSAITTLMPAYYFDAVEDQGKIVFVKRGGPIAAEIDDDDLGAHPSDVLEPQDLITTTRAMDEELPGTFNVNYVLAATNYSPATKYQRKLTGNSQSEQTMELPMVLTDQKAQEIASVNLHDAWISRITYGFALPRKYAYLMPTDIVGIQGYTMRLTKVTQDAGGFFTCEAARDDSDTYTPHVTVTETPSDLQTVFQPSPALLELM